jgi:perosamine synthetase
MSIPIYKPYIKNYKNSVLEAINNEHISSTYGIFKEKTEKLFQEKFNIKHCILMNNGTSATHCLFLGLKFVYPECKKIYVPNNVFIAAINCCVREYSPDDIEVMKIDETTTNILHDKNYIMSLEKNACVFVVHNLGYIVNVPLLSSWRPDLIFIEDNCEGVFGKYDGMFTGTCKNTLCSSVSFFGNKTITSGEGGAFFTNNTELYNYILLIHEHGMDKNEKYIHVDIGYNYRMTNLQAAILHDQMNDIDHILNKKNEIFKEYDLLLKNNKNIIKIRIEDDTEPSQWMYCIIIKNKTYKELNEQIKSFEIRPFFYDIRCHSHLKNIKIKTEMCDIFNHGIMLPSFPELTREQQGVIVKELLLNISR